MQAIVVEEQQPEAYQAPQVQEPVQRQYHEVPKKRGRSNKIVVVIILLSLIPAALGFFFLSRNKGENSNGFDEETPVPFIEQNKSTPTISPTPKSTTSPTPTPVATPYAKSEVKMKVLNGTGVSGEAAFLKKELNKLGYSQIEIGNAESKDYTETEVLYSRTVDSRVKDEINAFLEKTYAKVSPKTSISLDELQVQIIIGPRKQATTSPSPSSSPKSTLTPSPSPSPINQ